MPMPPPGPALPPPGTAAARLILKWILDLVNAYKAKPPQNPPQPMPPGMAELEAYSVILLAAGVVPAESLPS